MTDKNAKQTKTQFIIKIIIGFIFIAFCGLNITKPIFNFTNMPRILYNTVFILLIAYTVYDLYKIIKKRKIKSKNNHFNNFH